LVALAALIAALINAINAYVASLDATATALISWIKEKCADCRRRLHSCRFLNPPRDAPNHRQIHLATATLSF
jgi:hypothetical protein